MDYPEEWNNLPKHERWKKIKDLRKQREKKTIFIKKVRNIFIIVIVLAVLVFIFVQLARKSPEQAAYEQRVKEVSLEGKVQEFPIEGTAHISPDTKVYYQTNPPTSGNHLARPQEWGVYDREVDEKAVVHSLEHGGIWITYKNISDEDKAVLELIGKGNSQSVIVSPRLANEEKIAVVSWGKMMKLKSADKTTIQKYINTYKNQSPEKLAR